MKRHYAIPCSIALASVALVIVGLSQSQVSPHVAAHNPPVTIIAESIVPNYGQLLSQTVKVEVEDGSGTGVVITREVAGKRCAYVWTAGHVVEGLDEAVVSRELRKNGLLTDTVTAKARVIAYSAPDEQDLALLEIIENIEDFVVDVVCTFWLESEPLAIGTEIIHVGCTLGLYGSVSHGIISMTDRDLPKVTAHFDQTSCMGYPGSSGGGVYLLSGECIGLLVRGAGPGFNQIVPVRRMIEWAKTENLVWALDPTVPVPLERERTSLEKL